MPKISLKGKVIITGEIKAVTGLHIGGTTGGIDIGGVDLPVLRHPVNQEPYIPGSSLRGKMRSLLDRHVGKELNQRIGKVNIHSCKDEESYVKCTVCKIFGLPAERDFAEPARLLVRDVHLTPTSVEELRRKKIGLPFTEVKTEVAIDRVTSAAEPRQHERVPAGAVFAPCEMVFSIYSLNGGDCTKDIDFLCDVFKAMELLENDYLGGQGSRGSGKVEFRNFVMSFRSRGYYEGTVEPLELGKGQTLADLRANKYYIDRIKEKLIAEK